MKGEVDMIYKDLSNEEYHKMAGISSSILKAAIISEAHLENYIRKGVKNKAVVLGDAIHACLLEPERFEKSYGIEQDVYKKNINGHIAGSPKLDDDGEPIMAYRHNTDSSKDITGEEFKKLQAMIKAANESDEVKALLNNIESVEISLFLEEDGVIYKVRPDFITKDDWIVDIKSVGGFVDKPSAPENFGRSFYDYGYDIQMYMYYNVASKVLNKQFKGVKFLCLDATVPSGVQIYTFVNGESKWFELGGYRFKKALEIYNHYQQNKVHKVYENETPDDLPLSYKAEEYLAIARGE